MTRMTLLTRRHRGDPAPSAFGDDFLQRAADQSLDRLGLGVYIQARPDADAGELAKDQGVMRRRRVFGIDRVADHSPPTDGILGAECRRGAAQAVVPLSPRVGAPYPERIRLRVGRLRDCERRLHFLAAWSCGFFTSQRARFCLRCRRSWWTRNFLFAAVTRWAARQV
jgi:hypothetical protein